MPFRWLEEPHKATRSPGRVTPQHPRSVNGIQRTKANRPVSTIYDFYFQLDKLAAHRSGLRAAPPSHPTAMGGAHAAICRPRGGFAKQKLWLDRATIRFRFFGPSSFKTALQLVLRPHFLVHFVCYEVLAIWFGPELSCLVLG
jgi:hypothetical protein